MRIVIILLILISFSSYSQENENIFSVRIPSYEKGKIIQQTGYKLKGFAGIFTSLHGILHSKYPVLPINLYSQKTKKVYKDVHLLSYDIKNDVAQLTCPELSLKDKGFEIGKIPLKTNQEVEIIGHPSGIDQISRKATVGTPTTKKLKSLIASSGDNIDATMLNSDVYNLVGGFLKGSSGSPLLVGESTYGTLQGGLGPQISWGVPIESWALKSIESQKGYTANSNDFDKKYFEDVFHLKNINKINFQLDQNDYLTDIDTSLKPKPSYEYFSFYIKISFEEFPVVAGKILNEEALYLTLNVNQFASFEFSSSVKSSIHSKWLLIPIGNNKYLIGIEFNNRVLKSTIGSYLNVDCHDCTPKQKRTSSTEFPDTCVWELKEVDHNKYEIISYYGKSLISHLTRGDEYIGRAFSKKLWSFDTKFNQK